VDFFKPTGEDTFSAQLLVGVNGSGKSCFLEALGLIFTRIMQGEAPGFPFELEYRIQKGQAWVKVQPAGKETPSGAELNVTITTTTSGEPQRLGKIPEEYLPRRIIACSSGANHLMESILLSSPRASLASDLYDLARGDSSGRESDIAWLLEQYRALDTNPRIFSVDGRTAKLIVPVLFAIIPNYADRLLAESHFQLREELLRRVSGDIFPVAFSITVDEAVLQQVSEERRNSPQYNLLVKLFRTEQPDGSEPLHSWMVRRANWSADMSAGEDGPQMSQTAVFCYEPWPDRADQNWRWNRKLSEEFDGDPMLLLNVLMAAYRRNILLGVQLAFRSKESQGLLGIETLSDGELMWLARMGLVLMSRLSSSAETLFLFDEPDVHFNNEWNMDFIKTLRQCSETQGGNLQHEFVIATHSTLLLTDTFPEQINLFSAAEGNGVQVKKPPVSPFAAQQDELARLLFSASAVGSYAMQRVDSMMDQARTPEEILDLIRQTGPGYQRFRLYERYYELKTDQD